MASKLLMTQAEIDRDRDRWLTARRAGITASEIAAVLGISPHSSPFALFTEKQTGTAQEVKDDDVRRGIVLEPYVAQVFAARHEELAVLPGGLYCSQDRPWQMATFDRLAIDLAALGLPDGSHITPAGGELVARNGLPVQIKTFGTREGWGEPGSDSIPVHYRAQALWEMDVQDSELVIVPVLFWQDWQVVTYFITRDAGAADDITLMREEAEKFLKRLADDDPPPVDWTPATGKALRSRYSVLEDRQVRVNARLARRYRNARRAKSKAERALGQASNEIIAACGTAKYAVALIDGQEELVTTRSQYGHRSTDVELLRTKYPAAAKATERRTPVDRLYPSQWAKS